MDLLGRLLGKSQSVPEKVENPRLLKAMHEIALNDTPAKRKQLYAELLKATLILPTPEVIGKPGLQTSDGQTTIQIIGIKDANNVDVTPAFTDDEALRNWDPNTPSIALKARAFFEMLVPLPFQEVVINPFDPRRKMLRPGGRVTRREFESLAKGVPPEAIPAMRTVRQPAGTRLLFGKPKRVFADDVMERVKQTLAKVDGVESAFLLAVAYGDEQPHGAIAVRLAKPIAEEHLRFLAKLVLEIVRPLLADKEPFDLIPLGAEFYEDVARVVPPFYQQAN
jgi:SseB protein N-terminal domain/SseB protein C-terminal domain